MLRGGGGGSQAGLEMNGEGSRAGVGLKPGGAVVINDGESTQGCPGGVTHTRAPGILGMGTGACTQTEVGALRWPSDS